MPKSRVANSQGRGFWGPQSSRFRRRKKVLRDVDCPCPWNGEVCTNPDDCKYGCLFRRWADEEHHFHQVLSDRHHRMAGNTPIGRPGPPVVIVKERRKIVKNGRACEIVRPIIREEIEGERETSDRLVGQGLHRRDHRPYALIKLEQKREQLVRLLRERNVEVSDPKNRFQVYMAAREYTGSTNLKDSYSDDLKWLSAFETLIDRLRK